MLVQSKENTDSISGRTWGGYRAKRTEAIPDTSLFGSSLEIKSEKQREEMKNIDAKSVSFKSQGGKKIFTREKVLLPESAELLNHQKQVLAQQYFEAIEAKRAFEVAEKQRKTFAENIEQQEVTRKPEMEETGKFTRSDLENALVMNKVGFNNGRSFNHHKYKPKPPQHQYALIGPALQTGGDLIVERSEYARHPDEAYVTQPMGRRRKPLPEIPPKGDCKSPDAISVSDLPANIRHHFGTAVCKSALADPQKVKESLIETRRSSRPTRKPLLKPLQPADIKDTNMDPNYEAIGLSTRQNIFPGFTYDHKISHTKSVYSPDVHQRRQPDPDEWRYRRDDLTTWNEYDTLNKKLLKQWEKYDESQPKPQPNWDRNAKRPPKPPEEPPPKPKKKAPKKQDNKEKVTLENDLVFEDFEFKTPPLSPPTKPPPKDLIPALPNDDDFWDFYNQALPLP